MNEHYQRQLETRIDRALKRLPELQAPAGLAARVLRAIATTRDLPWYRCPWPAWPRPLQVASMSIMVGCFCAFLFAAWQLTRAAGYQAAWEEVWQLFSGFAYIGNLARVLVSALILVAGQLGTPFIIGCMVALALGYSLFVGLGTVYFRLAFGLRRTE